MASSSTSTNVGNMVVVTHVLPAAPSGEQQPLSERGRRFRRGQPKALGTVQIMIGAMVLVFGIVMAFFRPLLQTYSGIFVWGALIYIASGSVTVAAEKYLSLCLMTASLVLNIIAAVVAVTGIILYSLDATLWYSPGGYPYCYYLGFSMVLAVFQLLQLIVSITVAGFTGNATCGCCTERPHVIIQSVDGAFAAQAPPHFHAAPVAPAQPQPQEGLYDNCPDVGSTEPLVSEAAS